MDLDPVPIPDRLDEWDWKLLDPDLMPADAFEMLLPSHFARSSPALEELADKIGAHRRGDPLSLLKELNQAMYGAFKYKAKTTRVDSPIEDALTSQEGVCQDFAHIFITPSAWHEDPGPVRERIFVSPEARIGTVPVTAPRMPGWRPGFRARAGSGLTRPTTCSPPSVISVPPSDATTRMCRPRAECLRERRRPSSLCQ